MCCSHWQAMPECFLMARGWFTSALAHLDESSVSTRLRELHGLQRIHKPRPKASMSVSAMQLDLACGLARSRTALA